MRGNIKFEIQDDIEISLSLIIKILLLRVVHFIYLLLVLKKHQTDLIISVYVSTYSLFTPAQSFIHAFLYSDYLNIVIFQKYFPVSCTCIMRRYFSSCCES